MILTTFFFSSYKVQYLFYSNLSSYQLFQGTTDEFLLCLPNLILLSSLLSLVQNFFDSSELFTLQEKMYFTRLLDCYVFIKLNSVLFTLMLQQENMDFKPSRMLNNGERKQTGKQEGQYRCGLCAPLLLSKTGDQGTYPMEEKGSVRPEQYILLSLCNSKSKISRSSLFCTNFWNSNFQPKKCPKPKDNVN